jgi:hypothetical protein
MSPQSLETPSEKHCLEVLRNAWLEAEKVRKRTETAQRRTATCKKQRAARIRKAAQRLSTGVNNLPHCYCCHKKLVDQRSVFRGVGPQCWRFVQDALAGMKLEARGDSCAA